MKEVEVTMTSPHTILRLFCLTPQKDNVTGIKYDEEVH